jgi:hypothetical protein
MTSLSGTTHLETPTPPPAIEATKTDNNVFPLKQAEKESTSPLLMPKKINDPAQWDEAWFANYE